MIINPYIYGVDDALAFITAANITDTTQKSAITQLVADLKSANIWTKMKALYPFVGGTATTHKFNLKDPRDLDAAYRLNFFGGGSHSATGWKPNASNAYAELGSLNMNTISAIDYSVGVYLRTNEANGNYYDFGATNNVDTGWYMMNARGSIDQINYQAGSINVSPAGSNTNSQGFYQAVANSNNLTKVFKNGSVIITDTTTQTKTPFNQIMNIGRAVITTGGGYYSTREQAFFYISTGLTDAEIVSVRTAVYNYQNTLGRLAE